MKSDRVYTLMASYRDLHGNKLSGPIPTQIGNLSSLNFL